MKLNIRKKKSKDIFYGRKKPAVVSDDRKEGKDLTVGVS